MGRQGHVHLEKNLDQETGSPKDYHRVCMRNCKGNIVGTLLRMPHLQKFNSIFFECVVCFNLSESYPSLLLFQSHYFSVFSISIIFTFPLIKSNFVQRDNGIIFSLSTCKISSRYNHLSQFVIVNLGAGPGASHKLSFEWIAESFQALPRTCRVRSGICALSHLGSWDRDRTGWT